MKINIVENIIKALRICSDKTSDCKSCPFVEDVNCTDHIRQTAADFLEDMDEENKDLRAMLERNEEETADQLKVLEDLRDAKEDYDAALTSLTHEVRRADRLQGERDAYRDIIIRLCGEPQTPEAENE